MEFDNEFTVQAPIDEVWKTMLDVERVAGAVPGAKVTEQTGENTYKAEIKVKLGPISMTYKGDVEIVEADESAHRAVLAIKAREARGQGTATAKSELHLTEAEGGTHSKIHTDVSLTGRAASMGRGIIGDVSSKMVDTFAENLAGMLTAPAAAAEAGSGNGAGPTEAEAAVTSEATGGGTATQAPPKPPPAAPQQETEFDAGALGAELLVERLKDPRVIAVLAVAVLVVLLRRRR